MAVAKLCAALSSASRVSLASAVVTMPGKKSNRSIIDTGLGNLALAQRVDAKIFWAEQKRLPIRVEACNNRAFSKL